MKDDGEKGTLILFFLLLIGSNVFLLLNPKVESILRPSQWP
jgi:hypothetical protein